MDTITHVLFGSLTVKAIAPRKSKPENSLQDKDTLIIAAFASAFPDIDYLSFWINPLLFLAEWHRSITHSLFMVPLWGALLTAIFIAVLPRLRGSANIVFLYSVTALVSHIFLDTLTVYGTEVFYPFSDKAISFATSFVIDPYFSFIVAITLLFSLYIRSRLIAIAGIALILVYLSFQWQLKQDAIKTAKDYGNNKIKAGSNIIALPQPFSPFHWRLIIQNKDEYSTALLDITGYDKSNWPEIISAYHSPAHLDWQHYS